MTRKYLPDQDLEALFEVARNLPPVPAAGLSARILRDAETMQLEPAGVAGSARTGVLQTLLGALGGWPVLGGLATAGVVGFWIGINPPDMLEVPASAYFGQSEELALYDIGLSGFGWDVEER